MRHEILYQPSYSAARILLDQGESVIAEPGAMVSMGPAIRMQAQVAGGGVMGALKSALGGEDIFRTTFTAETGPDEILLAPSGTGDIMAVDLSGKLFVQRGSYLASSPGLETGVQGSIRAMLAGEGMFLLTLAGQGRAFLSSFGAIHAVTLAPGQEYIVDTSHIVAFDSSVNYRVEKASGPSSGLGGFLKGAVTSALSGEGLVCRYTGPGTLYIQTRSIQSFVQMLTPFMPMANSGAGRR